jgi:pimeloyl-ACP methyl ester carboxylesterase
MTEKDKSETPPKYFMKNTYWKTIVILAVVVAVFGIAAIVEQIEIKKIERAHPPTGRFVKVHSGRLHLVELGRRNERAVVLLHGATTNLEDMRLSLGDRLSAQYHVILIDRPGHGWSDRPDGGDDASPQQQAKLIHEALDQIGIQRAVFVAHSWAGAVALAYALVYPQGVAGLVLLAPLAYPQPPTVAWYKNFITALLAQSARTAASPVVGPIFAHTFLYPLGKLLLGLAVRSAFAPQAPAPDYIAKTGAELLLRPSEFISNGEDIALIDEFLGMQASKYGQIHVPTAIVTGDSDEVLSADANAKRLAKTIPHASLVVLPGVGHMVQYAATDRVIQEIGKIAE